MKDPQELEAEIQKAHAEILILQQRIREMEEKREKLLKQFKSNPKNGKNGKTGKA